jgi:hypothetical protein
VTPSPEGLNVSSSKQRRVDGVGFDSGDKSVEEGQVGEEGCEDRNTDTEDEEDKSRASASLSVRLKEEGLTYISHGGPHHPQSSSMSYSALPGR